MQWTEAREATRRGEAHKGTTGVVRGGKAVAMQLSLQQAKRRAMNPLLQQLEPLDLDLEGCRVDQDDLARLAEARNEHDADLLAIVRLDEACREGGLVPEEVDVRGLLEDERLLAAERVAPCAP